MARIFNKETDLEEIRDWHERRDMRFESWLVPDIGIIEPKVGAGFLMTTNTGAAFLEGYITNPNAKPEDRNAALDEITAGLCCLASNAGFKIAMAASKNEHIIVRAQKFGFKIVDDVTLMKKEL